MGLPVSYVDAHMAPDAGIPGLSDEMRCWAEKKGLLYVRDYYHFPDSGMPAFAPTEDTYQKSVDSWLNGMEEGEQYLYFMHPAKLSDETMAFANDEFKPGIVAWERELEYRSPYRLYGSNVLRSETFICCVIGKQPFQRY